MTAASHGARYSVLGSARPRVSLMKTRWVQRKCKSCALPFPCDTHDARISQQCKRCILISHDFTRFAKPFLDQDFIRLPVELRARLSTIVSEINKQYNAELRSNPLDRIEIWRTIEKRLAQKVSDDQALFLAFMSAIDAGAKPLDRSKDADIRAMKRNCDRETMIATRKRRWS